MEHKSEWSNEDSKEVYEHSLTEPCTRDRTTCRTLINVKKKTPLLRPCPVYRYCKRKFNKSMEDLSEHRFKELSYWHTMIDVTGDIYSEIKNPQTHKHSLLWRALLIHAFMTEDLWIFAWICLHICQCAYYNSVLIFDLCFSLWAVLPPTKHIFHWTISRTVRPGVCLCFLAVLLSD